MLCCTTNVGAGKGKAERVVELVAAALGAAALGATVGEQVVFLSIVLSDGRLGALISHISEAKYRSTPVISENV